ncbi:hypothetical protein [Salipiger marinus]|uniref:hypothetical protein n=1 Tax=Salipiger marinus TaxID=555512 RepID=UPI0013F4DED2|nr:hypothetical protein [Salipiger marinus]
MKAKSRGCLLAIFGFSQIVQNHDLPEAGQHVRRHRRQFLGPAQQPAFGGVKALGQLNQRFGRQEGRDDAHGSADLWPERGLPESVDRNAQLSAAFGQGADSAIDISDMILLSEAERDGSPSAPDDQG